MPGPLSVMRLTTRSLAPEQQAQNPYPVQTRQAAAVTAKIQEDHERKGVSMRGRWASVISEARKAAALQQQQQQQPGQAEQQSEGQAEQVQAISAVSVPRAAAAELLAFTVINGLLLLAKEKLGGIFVLACTPSWQYSPPAQSSIHDPGPQM